MLLLQPTVPLLTSLPAAPVDGQVILFQADATNGIVWQLRYRAASASAYKWELVGGVPLTSGPSGSITTSSATPVVITGGPSITLPLAGDWFIGAMSVIQQNNAITADMSATIFLNGATVSFGPRIIPTGQFGGGIMTTIPVWFAGRAAGDVWTLRAATNAGSGTFTNNMLSAVPVRVG